MPDSPPLPRTPADRWPDDTPDHADANRILREERFRLLVQGVTEHAIFLLDADGRVICWNTGAERIFGYTEAEVLDQPFARFFTPEDVVAGKAQEELQIAADTGSAKDDRYHIRKDGTRFFCRGTLTAIKQKGRLIGFAKVLHDLKAEQAERELRNQAEALLEADRLKNEFLAMLAHELRNPLAPILNAVQVRRAQEDQAKDVTTAALEVSLPGLNVALIHRPARRVSLPPATPSPGASQSAA